MLKQILKVFVLLEAFNGIEHGPIVGWLDIKGLHGL